MEGAVTHHESNKENIPPVCSYGEKKKNPIPPMPVSFKRNSKKYMKRVPLADITILFQNSAHDHNQVSPLPSTSVVLHSSSRKRTVALLRGSRTLRMGFR